MLVAVRCRETEHAASFPPLALPFAKDDTDGACRESLDRTLLAITEQPRSTSFSLSTSESSRSHPSGTSRKQATLVPSGWSTEPNETIDERVDKV